MSLHAKSKSKKVNPTEEALDTMLARGLIDITTKCNASYQMSEAFQNAMTLTQFHSRFYNWRRKKLAAREEARKGGAGPPVDALAGNSVLEGILNGCRNAPYVSSADATGSEQNDRLFGLSDTMELPFSLPSFMTQLKNEEGQRIIEVCLWLPSGVGLDKYCLYVSEDMKTLKFSVAMDPLMQDAWGLHRDLVPQGLIMKKNERQSFVRVHHWNTVMEELRSDEGQLPKFVAELQLPEELRSKKFLRKIGKGSPDGTRMLLVDLFVEDSKLPANDLRRTFDLIDGDDDDPIVVDENCHKKRG